MKILHQTGNSRLAIEDVPTPAPGPGEVLIKTAVSALCGSEMSTYRGKDGRTHGNMGHEAAGTIAAFGPGADTIKNPVTHAPLKIGERVGVSAIAGWPGENPSVPDPHYIAGRYTWCDKFTFHCDMHAEYFTIPAQACHVLPDDIPWDIGVLITGDGFGVPYHTSTKLPPPDSSNEQQTVAIFGLGPIGLGNVIMQTYLGRRVIGIDRAPARLELAHQLGAAHTIEASDNANIPAAIRDLTHNVGTDIAIEAAGVPATTRLCFASVRKGGTVIFNGEQPALELSPSEDFIRRDITATGSWFYHFCEYPDMLAKTHNGLPVASLITHRFPLSNAAEAYHVMQSGLSGKVLLTHSE
ncbi:zinc-dependent alcohol dehydrogenase [Geminisphaera colitermitum]|uniref:zinc-dependent alcohol dehydrogenase n=1 Tax=Geminisphaera colitermitum TaxID=1148786 RepID=UPI000158C52A|nr:zinc-binding dehydrogenase [Geminisphaera colitermitum]